MMRRPRLRNQRGQFVIEGILLMVVLLGVGLFLTSKIKELGVVSKMVTGPWAKIAGMTETGTWNEPTNASRKVHPNNYSRLFTPEH